MLALLLLSAVHVCGGVPPATKRETCGVYGPTVCRPDNAALRIFEAITKLQNPHNCSTTPILLNIWPFRRAGLGSRFSFYKAQLALAYSEGRTYVDHACFDAGDCLPQFVQPWTSCTKRDVAAARSRGLVRILPNPIFYPRQHRRPQQHGPHFLLRSAMSIAIPFPPPPFALAQRWSKGLPKPAD